MRQSTFHKDHWRTPQLVDVLHNRYTAWVVLFVSLVITLVAWKISSDYAEQRLVERFKFQVEEAQFAIEKRMTDYQQVLRGGLALFKSAKQVDREMWRTYVQTLELNDSYPGIQGVGYALWLQPGQKALIEQQVREEGFSDFTIRPAGTREQYTTILYLEPFDIRNRRAFGYDMFSEATRREAMLRAMDSGEAAMSGTVKLVQEMETDIQPGFLIYLPLYDKKVTTLAERRAHLQGFVYSPFRVRDLMQGILGRGSPEVAFEIYDGGSFDPETLLYDSLESPNTSHQDHPHGRFDEKRQLMIAGHTWSVHFTSTPKLETNVDASQPMFLAIGGVCIDLLLFYIIISLSQLRHRADKLAKERMDELQEQELHFKTIADTANEGIITSDENGVISYCNRAAAEIFSASGQALLGTRVENLFARNQYDQIVERAQRYVQGEAAAAPMQSHHREIQGFRVDGQVVPLELSVACWRSGGRQFTTSIMRDITERKRMDRMKNEFVSTVSHELRTPLTAIHGSLALIAEGVVGHINGKAGVLVENALRNSERLTRLINDILDVEKIASGKMNFDFKPQSTGTLMQYAREYCQGMALASRVTLSMDVCDDVEVCVDVDRFQQVMSNLISNAIKFSPAGGKVTLSCCRRQAMVRIAVNDEGPGVPEEFRERIFQPFAQADSSDTREKGGTGLGLSIVSAIIKNFGGCVGYESNSGQGATFYFEIPLAEADKCQL